MLGPQGSQVAAYSINQLIQRVYIDQAALFTQYPFSTTKHHRVRLKVLLNEDDPLVPSVTGIWRTANWHERETYDLFGVIFDNHPDLRRILLPDDWQGHALRKDFPLRGYEPYSLE